MYCDHDLHRQINQAFCLCFSFHINHEIVQAMTGPYNKLWLKLDISSLCTANTLNKHAEFTSVFIGFVELFNACSIPGFVFYSTPSVVLIVN